MTEFVVRGTASRIFAAESVTLPLAAEFEDSKSVVAHEKAVALQAELIAAVRELEAAGRVARWTSDRVHSHSYHPTDRDGRIQPAVHHTSIGLSVEFTDFDVLAPFMDAWGARDGVQLGTLHWDVLRDNRIDYEDALRTAAVHDAMRKAQAYADVVGAGAVRALVIADSGMLSAGAEPNHGPVPRFALAASAGAPALEIQSSGVEIQVSVDGRFEAGTR